MHPTPRSLSHIVLASTLFLVSTSYADTTISTATTTPLQTSTNGNITVTNSGSINTAPSAITANSDNATITNAGSIISTNNAAISVTSNNVTVTNQTGGIIQETGGGARSIFVTAGSGFTLVNNGSIPTPIQAAVQTDVPFNTITNNGSMSTGGPSWAIFVTGPGQVFNNAGATITSGPLPVATAGNNLIFNNAGTISASAGTGVFLGGNNITLNNNNGGLIQSSGGPGVSIVATLSALNNTGDIKANNAAGSAVNSGTNASGTLTNTGTINNTGGGLAIDLSAANTTILLQQNGGTITGNVRLSSGGGNVLNMSGGTITGTITATLNAQNTLNLAGGSIGNTLTLGNQGDTVNLGNTQAQTIQGGIGNDIFNIQGASGIFTLLDGGAGNNTFNVNTSFILSNPIQNIQTINVNNADTIFTLDTDISATNFTSINPGATLAITAPRTINSNVNTLGTLSVGNDAPLNIIGNFNLNADSVLNIDMGGTPTTSIIDVTGTTSIDESARIFVSNPGAPGSTVINTIITDVGGGGKGLFAIPASSSSSLVSFITQVNGNQLNLIMTSSIPYTGSQSNTQGIADALNSIRSSDTPPTGALNDIINALNTLNVPPDSNNVLLTTNTFSADLNNAFATTGTFFADVHAPTTTGTLSTKINNALATAAPIVDGAIFYETFTTQLQSFRTTKERTASSRHARAPKQSALVGYAAGDKEGLYVLGSWVQLFGQYANQETQDDIAGYRANTSGIAGGIDKTFSENTLIGLALSWSKLNLHHHVAPNSKTTANSYQGSIYGSYHLNAVYLDWVAAIAYNDYTNQHNIVIGDLNFTPRGTFHGWQSSVSGETGYVFTKNHFHSVPIASLYYSYLDLHGYTETGVNTANQMISGAHYQILQGGIGIKFMYDYIRGNYLFLPEVHLVAFYDFISNTMQTTSQFTGAGPSFSTEGANPVQDSYNIGGSISILKFKGITVTASYDYTYKRHYTAHAGFLQLRV